MLYYAPSPPNILPILLSVRNPHLSLLPILSAQSPTSPSQSTVCNPHTPSPTYNPHPLHPPNPQCTIHNIPSAPAVPIFLRRVPPRGSCAAATRATLAGFGTLEEILALRHVWITLRQQLHECLSPVQGRVVGQLLK